MQESFRCQGESRNQVKSTRRPNLAKTIINLLYQQSARRRLKYGYRSGIVASGPRGFEEKAFARSSPGQRSSKA